MKTPIELFGIECGNGWHPLLEPICEYILKYNSGKDGREHIELLISDAEQKSKTICETCGNPGILRNVNGWYRTLCESCSNKEL